MTLRVSKEDLEAIYRSPVEDAPAEASLRWASSIVNQYLKGKCNVSEETLKEIETFLAAHAYSYMFEGSGSAAGGAVRYREDRVEIQYKDVSTDFLAQTRYGQMAILLDPCSILSTLGRRRARACLL